MRSYRFLAWSMLAIALFVGGFAYTYNRLMAREASPQAAKQSDAVERLGAQASVILRYVLPDGRLGGEEHLASVPAEIIGASREELSEIYPTWSVVSFAVGELVAEVRCAGTNGGYLGERNGMVAVYEGLPGPCSVLREYTDIPVDSVHPEERAKLAQGAIRYTDDDNLQELLDGLLGD